ncbi:putative membrane protein [Azospirillum agricola]|uniref:YgaP family membrane protein n=1 Tax=Azospirillum agricola TaxID=1720247 RepID=UPI001AE1B513|nr:DUF2892 domain-containing protein [Azospirillum agricola]MBP2228571.1 putative membrane protein [Azospirillum agricola]
MSAQSTIRHAYDSAFQGGQNLGLGERVLSTGLGLAVAAGGLRKGASVPGAIMGLVGAALVARGMSGHCPIKERLEGGGSHERLGWDEGTSHDRAEAPPVPEMTRSY